jgi:hypothetical protein
MSETQAGLLGFAGDPVLLNMGGFSPKKFL